MKSKMGSQEMAGKRLGSTSFRWAMIILIGLGLIVWVSLAFGQNPRTNQAAIVPVEDISELQPMHASSSRSMQPDSHLSGGEPDESAPPPQASLETAFFDFGVIGEKEPVSQEFYLGNTGEGTLVIQQAYTTCLCTTAEISGTVIEEGKAGRITVTFDPRVHNVAGTTVRRGLILETNDPLHPTLEIWVQATVR